MAICLGYFMIILDTTIVNIALVNMQQQLGASVNNLQWVVDGYTLVFASLLLTAGALGDRFGNKRVFLIGLALFIFASALCGIAPTLWILELVRLLQGIGAALMLPASLALLNTLSDDPRVRAKNIGIWGGIAGIGALSGPLVGGILVNAFGWRSIFLVNIPIGLLALALTWRFVMPVSSQRQKSIDLLAQITGILALAALTLACIQGNSWGWTSWPILVAFSIFVLATASFILIERRSASPMLPLKLFGSPAFSAATLVGLLLNFGFYGQLFYISIYFQHVRGYSSLLAGLALMPETGMAIISSTLSGRLTAKTGPRLPMLIGLTLGGGSLLLLAFVGATTSYGLLCLLLIAIGAGMSCTMPAMTTALLASVPPERSAIAAGVLNASRQVGSVLGVAILGTLVDAGSSFMAGMHLASLLAGLAFLLGCVLTWRYVGTRKSR